MNDGMTGDVILREGSPADLPEVSRFVLAVCERDVFGHFGAEGRNTLRDIYGLESLRTQQRTGGSLVLAEAGDELVGAAALRAPEHVFLLYVLGSYRRQGLGKRLMQRLVSLREETARVTLNAHLEAVPFYESLGFRAAGPGRTDKGLHFLPMALERGPSRDGNGP